MFDSSSKKRDPNNEDDNLRSHDSKFNIYDQPNVDVFFNAYRNTDIIMSILNRDDFTYADINDSWVNAFGYSRQEVIGQRHSALSLWIDEMQDEQKYLEIKKNNGLHSYEVE